MDWLPLIGSALLSGLVAILVTVAIERFGGVVGGLLGTLPTTIVPASLGIGWSTDGGGPVFVAAMATVPVGMLINAGFLWLWRVLPDRLPEADLRMRLAAMVAASVAVWAATAVPTMSALNTLQTPGSALIVGAMALAATALVGAVASFRRRPAPRGTRPVGPGVLLARGALAAVAVGLATAVAQTGDGVLAGVLSVFPAIFLTTMIGLWLSQDEAVPGGAIGPMMLGSTAVGGYALTVIAAASALGVVVGAMVAWVLAVLVCTLPAWTWLRFTQR